MKRAAFALMLIVAACKKGGGGSDLSFGKPGEPFGVLSKITFGEEDKDTVKKVPELEYTKLTGRWRPNDKTEIEVTSIALVGDLSRRTSKISVRYDDKKKEDLIKVWGPGKDGKDVLDAPATYYVNAAGTVRAQLSEPNGTLWVEFLPLIPLAKLVSADGSTVAGIKLLGEPKEAIEKAATKAGYETEKGKLKLPVTEWGAAHTLVTYEVTGGTVDRYTVFLDTKLSPTAKDDTLAALERVLGKPTPTKNTIGDDELVYKADKPRIAVRPSNDTLYLEVKQ